MSDRELLEKAAKAEGHGVEFDESGLSFFDTRYTGLLWNPLHHDGDALRLGHKLGLFTDVSVWPSDIAAFRRAIVEEAAKLAT